MSKREKRLEAKKRKIEAFLKIAKLNDEENGVLSEKKQKLEDSQIISTTAANEVQKNAETQATDGIGRTASTEEEMERLRAEFRERRKANMELPKLYLTLENIQHPLKQNVAGENTSPISPGSQPMLFMADIQHLLLYAVQGNAASYKPRWCRLLRWTKVKHVMVIVVDDLSETEYTEYSQDLSYMKENFEDQVTVACPSQYGSNIAKDLFHVPMSISRLISCRALSRRDIQQLSDKNSNQPEQTSAELGTDTSAGDRDFSRVDLLLSPEQMIQEGFPLPVNDEMINNYVYSCDDYSEVNEKSLMFAIDCEMCLSMDNNFVLTRVAVVDETLKVVYESIVKPDVMIKDYLTRFSGITKKMLADVTTSLSDVQQALRKILPSDAILCGQSLRGDLHALQMFHPYVIDTSVIFNISGSRHIKPGLRRLAAQYLKRDIQNDPSGHNPAEDAIATMELVNLKLSKGITFGDVSLGVFPTVISQAGSDEVSCKADSPNDLSRPGARKNLDFISEESEKDSSKAASACEGQSKAAKSIANQRFFFQRPHHEIYESFFSLAKEVKKSVVIVGREEEVKPYIKETQTIMAETDKTIAQEMTRHHWNHHMTYCSLNGFSRCLRDNLNKDLLQKKLRKIDNRIKKMGNCLAHGSLLIVLFSGRTADQIHNARCFVKIT